MSVKLVLEVCHQFTKCDKSSKNSVVSSTIYQKKIYKILMAGTHWHSIYFQHQLSLWSLFVFEFRIPISIKFLFSIRVLINLLISETYKPAVNIATDKIVHYLERRMASPRHDISFEFVE